MMKEFEDNSSTNITSSYDSRSRFIKNAKQNNMASAKDQVIVMVDIDMEETRIESLSLPLYTLPIESKYMQRKRNNSVCLKPEVKYIDDNTLIKVTCDFYNMLESSP